MAETNTTIQEIIVCMPYSDIAEYQGTRAALEAEGVIPAGTKWPEGFRDIRWEDDHLRYWLRRERPEGAKGPRKQFLTFDWWRVRFDPIKTESWEGRMVRQKAKELEDAIFNQSKEGRAFSNLQMSRIVKARSDEKFRAFVKELIPSIDQPKRGRKTKQVQKANSSPDLSSASS